MNVRELTVQLIGSGWPNRRLAVIAARYYLGIETDKDLQSRADNRDHLTHSEANMIQRAR